jgi:hypothetical protein
MHVYVVPALTLFTFVARLKFQVLAALHKDKNLDFFFSFLSAGVFYFDQNKFWYIGLLG